MVIVAICSMLMMFILTARGESILKIKEVKVWQSGADEMEIQVRTDDGRPVKFELRYESGEIVSNLQIIHSKITTIKKLKKGTYTYHCESHDGHVQQGKTAVR